ncbi:MAG: hypothetical protein CO096_29560 [Armatimonadetes bacterium CG_4_9_14_3_um_filter_66_14]|nr:TlpA family protein disulfide reductase [Armatimonadota bacterium]PIU87717.1 MAG: hypothetical protein COS65_33210 [Armatimonadetes bacterium CG06_land_8_20_14_3_00_66_21]PJB61281.1 MAG: hypothetical protein CO096_29560 [Armatimonadetes bacterium CG_4_9_14_3_um_filter_66_14]
MTRPTGTVLSRWGGVMVALVATAVLAGEIPSAEEPAGLRVGTKAPAFTLKGWDGKTYKLSDFRGKKVVLLDFGRFTCIPCRSVVQDLEKLQAKYKNKGVQILSVNLDGPFAQEAVPKGIKEFKLTFPVLLDSKFEAAQAYKVQTIPHLYVVDTKGIVRLSHLGYDPDLQKILSEQFEKYRPKSSR